MSATLPLVRRPLCASAAARPVAIGRRLRWLVVALAAVALLVPTWPGAWVGVGALLAPDLPLLLAGAWAEAGRLRPWAVPFYNAMHAVAGPLVLGAAGGAALALGAGTGAVVVGTASGWLAHVAVDRIMGYDLRDQFGEIRR